MASYQHTATHGTTPMPMEMHPRGRFAQLDLPVTMVLHTFSDADRRMLDDAFLRLGGGNLTGLEDTFWGDHKSRRIKALVLNEEYSLLVCPDTEPPTVTQIVETQQLRRFQV